MKRLILAVIALVAACGGSVPSARTALQDVRRAAESSRDPEVIGPWAIAEAIQPGGDPAKLALAEKKLAELPGGGLSAELARAALAEAHGEPAKAAPAYVNALARASESRDPVAPLAAWHAVRRLRALRGTVAHLWSKNEATLERVRKAPGAIGWRAESELVEWFALEAFDKGTARGKDYDDLVVRESGCVRGLRLAGPFGRGTSPDRRRSFAPEKPGPWPPAWPEDPRTGIVPKVRETTQPRCLAVSAERAGAGVFYAETFVTVERTTDVILAVQGAVAVWVDDAPVLDRDLREWGVWQKFGAAVRLSAGRHRVLARVVDDVVAVRLLAPDGTPAKFEASADPGPGYAMGAPVILADPNPLAPVIRAAKGESPLQTWLAAQVAHSEGLDDVASVLLEPLVTPDDAAPLALELAANAVRGDPLYPEEVRRRMEHAMRARAISRDPRLWVSRVAVALEEVEHKGLFESVEPLRKLALEFPGEPEIPQALARIYGKLGWRAERLRTVADVAARFPDDTDSLRAHLDALEEDGAAHEADAIADRIQKLDPDAELDLQRALARQDYKAAIAELERIGKRRPDRKDIAERIAHVLARAGDPSAAAKQLEKAIEKNPLDSASRFKLADFAYAKGDDQALRSALAEALQVGGSTATIANAIDLLEGATDLEDYRVDGKKVIAEFVAWEKAGNKMGGVSARVLDYAATWVHPDGSSEMLEHEIQKLQSQEAIGKEAEQKVPEGLVLRIRVIKPDGRVLEPEPVAGKPTLTMPQMEVGDFLEIEHIVSQRGDGERGRRYRGPHWFFREADKGYWRSEFVTLTPKDKPVEIETRGNVPPPKIKTTATLVERRWRIDQSPPIAEEENSPPPQEFLPSVRVGWGVTLEESLDRFVDAVSDEIPLDPRLRAYALDLVRGAPNTPEARAQKVYRALLDRVQDGQETDGRRVITGKSGSRQNAFIHLMKQLEIPVEIALVKNKLAMPPLGKMSEVESWDSLLLRVGAGKQPIWLSVRDRFAPFGYVPAESRGQPAYRLIPGTPMDTVTRAGAEDAIVYEGRADVREDGGATVDLSLRYAGKLGIQARNMVDKVPEAQRKDFVETRLIARTLPGARVRDLQVEHQKDLDLPITIHVKADVPQLVKSSGARLVLNPLFPSRVAQLASLPQRQTPLLLPSPMRMEVRFEVVFPSSWKMPASLPVAEHKDGDRVVSVKDSVAGHAVQLERVVDIPAGRIDPTAYEAFTRFAQDADASLEREIVLQR